MQCNEWNKYELNKKNSLDDIINKIVINQMWNGLPEIAPGSNRDAKDK